MYLCFIKGFNKLLWFLKGYKYTLHPHVCYLKYNSTFKLQRDKFQMDIRPDVYKRSFVTTSTRYQILTRRQPEFRGKIHALMDKTVR